ncbi:MAG: TlpA family protein disulfide reductase [Actinobacteria bacterium]|nr:TlpA family protein disulfide reductase [Actinomycetota bacterium]
MSRGGNSGSNGGGLDPRKDAKRERRAAAKVERERQARRTKTMARARVGALTLVLVVAGGALALGIVRDLQPSGVAFAGDLRRGGTLEELRLPRLEGDGAVEYAAYADRPLVINFFASWCPNCIAEMPEFERVHGVLGDRVAFLGVSQSDARGASIDLARETGITYDTAIDERGEFFNAVGGQGMPTTIFVRPGGEIAEIWVGALDAGTLRQLVADNFGVVA